MGEGACYAKNIYYRQICLFLNDLLHRNDSFSQTYSHVEAGIPLPGFRRDFFRVPASLCFVLGVSHGYKPTSRACKFRFILSLSTLRCHLWEDESRLRLDFFLFFLPPLPSFGTETPVASVSKDRCNFLLRLKPREQEAPFPSTLFFKINLKILLSTLPFELFRHESDCNFRGNRGGGSL